MLLNRSIGATLLVAGTGIGAGMLALPISTAHAGFFWSGALIIGAWFLMLITGFLVAEVNLNLKGNVSYISMAEKTLGKFAKSVTWLLFLGLLYSLMAAYILGGSALITSGVSGYLGHPINHWFGLAPWVLVFSVLIYLGTKPVDIINKFLVLGLFVGFIAVFVILAPHVAWQPAAFPVHHDYLWAALPMVMASYGYHIVVPTVSRYLDHDKAKLLRAIFWGSFLALVFYLIWQYLVLGVLSGKELMVILNSGEPTASLSSSLQAASANTWLGMSVRVFACFALCSSFVGVAMGLFHLLCDGLNLPQSFFGKFLGALLTFSPPLVFALFYPQGFIMALSYAGVIVALIHGVLPAMMAWAERNNPAVTLEYKVFGGKLLLVVVIILSLIVLGAEVTGHMGIVPLL